MNRIYEMKLHEKLTLKSDANIQIIRVPSGWIYRFWELQQGSSEYPVENYIIDNVFVPLKENDNDVI